MEKMYTGRHNLLASTILFFQNEFEVQLQYKTIQLLSLIMFMDKRKKMRKYKCVDEELKGYIFRSF